MRGINFVSGVSRGGGADDGQWFCFFVGGAAAAAAAATRCRDARVRSSVGCATYRRVSFFFVCILGLVLFYSCVQVRWFSFDAFRAGVGCPCARLLPGSCVARWTLDLSNMRRQGIRRRRDGLVCLLEKGAERRAAGSTQLVVRCITYCRSPRKVMIVFVRSERRRVGAWSVV